MTAVAHPNKIAAAIPAAMRPTVASVPSPSFATATAKSRMVRVVRAVRMGVMTCLSFAVELVDDAKIGLADGLTGFQ